MTRALALFALLPACVVRIQTATDAVTFTDPVREVRLDVESGGVTLVAGDPGSITIIRDSEWHRDAPNLEAWVEEEVLYVRAHCAGAGLLCATHHEVVVPDDVAVTVELGSGGIALEGVGGDLDLSLGSGGVEGSVSSEVLLADVGSGGFDVRFHAQPLAVDLSIGSGGAELEVPAGAYYVEAEAGSGGVNYEGIQQSAEAGSSLHVEVGSGGIEIRGY